MSATQQLPVKLTGLTVREAVFDAITRVIAGLDAQDAELYKSGIMPGEKTFFEVVNFNIRVEGSEKLNDYLINKVIPLSTLHQLTNVRIEVAGEEATTAKVTCNAVAYHYKSEDAFSPEPKAYTTAGQYFIDVVKDTSDGLWKVSGWTLKGNWVEGDQAVIS